MRQMAVHASTKNYNNLFTSLILNSVLDATSLKDRLKAGTDATTYIPLDDDVRNSFHTAKLYNLQTKGILYLLESGICPADCSTALLGFNGYSLEHLMPKKWKNNWPQCATEKLAEERDSILLTLGNLDIITQSLNSSIRDADWETKKKEKNLETRGFRQKEKQGSFVSKLPCLFGCYEPYRCQVNVGSLQSKRFVFHPYRINLTHFYNNKLLFYNDLV